MITTSGLAVINQYLTNGISSWAGSIALGGLSSSATSSSTQFLQHEFLRVPVIFRAYRNVSGTNQVVLKASFDPTSVFQAYEIGVFPMTVLTDGFIDQYQITNFSESYSGSSSWYVGGVPATTASSSPTPRVGTADVRLTSGSTAILPGSSSTTFALSTSNYTAADSVHILYYVSSSISSASLTVSFADDYVTGANVWTGSAVITSAASGAFYSSSLVFPDKPTNFTDNVVSVSVQLAGTGTVYLDQMKFVTGDTKTSEYLLVSRTASATPLITKVYGQPMDIEYYVQVT